MGSKRALKLPPQERDDKTTMTIRASERTCRRLDSIRLNLIRSITSSGVELPDNWPFSFNRDSCLSLILRVFARDYGFKLDEEETQ